MLVVNCPGIVEDTANNCLHLFDTGGIKWSTSVDFNNLQLGIGAVDNIAMLIWGVL